MRIAQSFSQSCSVGAGKAWLMTCNARRYSGTGKAARENRYLGGWAAFARAHSSMQAGGSVSLSYYPDTPNELHVSIAQPAADQEANDQGAETEVTGQLDEASNAQEMMQLLAASPVPESGEGPSAP